MDSVLLHLCYDCYLCCCVNALTWRRLLVFLGTEHGLERAAGQEGEATVCSDHPGRQRRQQLRWRVHLGGSRADAPPGAAAAQLGRAEHVLGLRLHRRLVLAPGPSPTRPPVWALWSSKAANDQWLASHHFDPSPASPGPSWPGCRAVARGSSVTAVPYRRPAPSPPSPAHQLPHSIFNPHEELFIRKMRLLQEWRICAHTHTHTSCRTTENVFEMTASLQSYYSASLSSNLYRFSLFFFIIPFSFSLKNEPLPQEMLVSL